ILCAATICGFSRVSRDAIAAQIAPCGITTQAICNAEAAPARRWINAQIVAAQSIASGHSIEAVHQQS
ncbi:MAG: hypothetical protein WC091_23345, partial [Sulfuricellaceae bacterium]